METEESIAKKNGKQASMEMVTGKIWKAGVMGRWEGVQSDLCKGNRRRGRYKGEIRVTPELNSTLCWLGDVWPCTQRLGLCHYREHKGGSTRVMLSTPKAGLRKKWMWMWKMANQEELDEWHHSLINAVWGGACKDRQGCELGRILQSVSELTVVGMRYWMNGQMLTG